MEDSGLSTKSQFEQFMQKEEQFDQKSRKRVLAPVMKMKDNHFDSTEDSNENDMGDIQNNDFVTRYNTAFQDP